MIDLLALKSNTITNSTQLSNWFHSVESNLYEATSFYGLALFSYVIRAIKGHNGQDDLIPGILCSDRCKSVARLSGKNSDGNNRRFYT